MKVKLADCAGFCFGVKRAVDMVYEQIKNGKNIYTYGPIVHNEAVVQELAAQGVGVLSSPEELMALPEGGDGEAARVVIRAHGVPEEIYTLLKEKNLECIDATCPFVGRIHRLVEQESGKGKHIIIIGNAGHPEVEGIKSRCRGAVTVLGDPEEVEKFQPPEAKELYVVSQTTFNNNKFHKMVEILEEKGYNVNVVNTICNATEERQKEAGQIAAKVDAMIVIGGRHSSNTQKLFGICREKCNATYYIQTLDDLQLDFPESVFRVGITAGASTPNYIIEEVQNYVRVNF